MAPEAFRLEDNYDIIRTLGEGGFGAVFIAEQRSLGRRVVIKTIRNALAGDATARERFRREALEVAQLKHPNIVTYHDFHEDAEGNLYIVMEYLDGVTLSEHLKGAGPMSPEEAVGILKGLCGALVASHERGITHRDLKPANVLLVGPEEDRRAVLIDFGLLKTQRGDESLTQQGMMLGTPTYMAPEQIQAKGIGPWTDLYALGVIGYEMLSGANPFRTADIRETVFRQLHHDPRNLSTLDLPRPIARRLATLVQRLLDKDPTRRIREATEVREELKHVLSFSERSTYAVSKIPVLRSPRARWALALLGLLVIGSGLGLLVARANWSPSPSRGQLSRPLDDARRRLRAWRNAPDSLRTASARARRGLETALSGAPAPGKASILRVTENPMRSARAHRKGSRAAPARLGRLTVTAKPWGKVSIDGVPIGNTPLTEHALSTGSHWITVEHPSHGIWKRKVQIERGATKKLKADLAPAAKR